MSVLADTTVILCTFATDRWQQLEAAVESVQQQTVPSQQIVIVVDRNDDLLQRCSVRWPDLDVVANTGSHGLAEARNTGSSVATGEIVAFLDDDAVADPKWLQTLLAPYADPAVLGVGGSAEPRWPDGRPRWFAPEFDWVVGCTYAGFAGTAAPVRNLIGANMSFRRAVLQELGGFRTTLGRVGRRPFGDEETDLCIRAVEQRPGGTILYAPRATVVHFIAPERARLGYFLGRCIAEGRSKAKLARLVGANAALSSERAYVGRTLPGALRRGLRETIRGDGSGLLRSAAVVLGASTTAASFGLARLLTALRTRTTRAGATRTAGSPLRVLMVTPRFLPEIGGVERHVFEVSRRLASNDCDVTVLCTDRTGTLPTREQRDGVNIRRIRAWPKGRDWRIAPGITGVVSQGRWDLIHVQSYHTAVAPIAMRAAHKMNLPYVVTFHGGGHSSRVRRSLRPLQRRLLRPLLAGAERLVAVARFEIDAYADELGLPRERFELIPNGIELVASDGVMPATRDCPALVASVGRLERYKGHQRAIAALPQLLRHRPDARLWIAGHGPYENELRNQAKRLGVEDRVDIEPVGPEQVPSRLGAAGVVLVLSDFETQPIVALEALAAGRPVVATDHPWAHELAELGTVRIVTADATPDELTDAIVSSLDETDVGPSSGLPTWDDCATRLAEMYRAIVGG